jgi:hypothetical protein
MKTISFAVLGLLISGIAQAETLTLSGSDITEWKAVQARVESRDMVPARARIGGIIEELNDQRGRSGHGRPALGLVIDDKIAFQIAALDAQLAALARTT